MVRRAGLVLVTDAMQCAARELGHFLLVRGSRRRRSSRSWVARCGAPADETTQL
ncbi:MAG TPA: hypothetical protein VKM54_23375 [Myxococcota bacterium]|nr:hypothetical protein [Myxococcota bacterium]